eukprot:TRINITY_DN13276_c0_g1_i1.p1 TRINITY_DN13276_c0_g1~~TRINITY_DN13276_c0_g1_i1.p1  ORF type:complete len:372 (-),score=66.31 TRINITY_DN13276_c0_g1_i1:950-2065(-)
MSWSSTGWEGWSWNSQADTSKGGWADDESWTDRVWQNSTDKVLPPDTSHHEETSSSSSQDESEELQMLCGDSDQALLAALEQGFQEASLRKDENSPCETEVTDLLRLLPNKEWIPFASSELSPHQGVFGMADPAVEFYLKPSVMPAGGFFDWKADPVYQKDLAFLKKDSSFEIRLNKEISTRWTASDLLEFSESRLMEFEVSNVVTTVHRIAKASDRWAYKRDPRLARLFVQAVDVACDPDRNATARDLAKTQWAMGRLKHTERQVQDMLSAEVARRVSEFEAQGLSNIIWGYAYSGLPTKKVIETVLAGFANTVCDCDPQALSNVSWSMAKMVISNGPLLFNISKAAASKVEAFDPQGLANLAWAFAVVQ